MLSAGSRLSTKTPKLLAKTSTGPTSHPAYLDPLAASAARTPPCSQAQQAQDKQAPMRHLCRTRPRTQSIPITRTAQRVQKYLALHSRLLRVQSTDRHASVIDQQQRRGYRFVGKAFFTLVRVQSTHGANRTHRAPFAACFVARIPASAIIPPGPSHSTPGPALQRTCIAA